MSALDIVLLVIIGSAVFGALRYMIHTNKKGGCVGCSGCCKSCRMHHSRCASNSIDGPEIHIKRLTP